MQSNASLFLLKLYFYNESLMS